MNWLKEKKVNILIAFVVGAAVALRFWIIFYWLPPENAVDSDMVEYLKHASDFLTGHKNPMQFFTPPGLSLLIAVTYSKSAHFLVFKWVELALSILTVFLVWRGATVWCGHRIGVFTLILISFHLPLILFLGFFLTETISAFIIALLFYFLVLFPFPWKPWPAFFIGATAMSGMWFKGTTNFIVPILFFWSCFLFFKKTCDRRGLLKIIFCFLMGVATVVGSFACFSHYWIGQTLFSATNGGLNFLEGKCPQKNNFDNRGHHYLSPVFFQNNQLVKKVWPEPFYNQVFYFRQGLNCIKENPNVIFYSFKYIYYLFLGNEIWPLVSWPKTKRINHLFYWIFALLYLPGIIFALFQIGRGWLADTSKQIPPPLLITVSLFFVVYFFKGEARLRVPFDVVLLPLAVMGWNLLIQCAVGNNIEKFRRTKGARL